MGVNGGKTCRKEVRNEMPNISGLKEGTKESFVEFCQRQKITQIQWVEKHLADDLAQEQAEAPEKVKGGKTR